MRVVSHTGELLGIIPTADAQQVAYDEGLDLVEVAPNEKPPVCRIMDYGKFKYEQKKRLAKNSKQHHVQLKEIRVRPKTGNHDIEFKVKRARTFLQGRDKVKVNIIFRGRELAHKDRGMEILNSIIADLDDIAKVEKFPSMEGRNQMSAILAPRAT